MKYLCLVYMEAEKLHAVPDAECRDCGADLRARGLLLAAEALQPVETAATVRLRNGSVSVTDGPFAETKEQLAVGRIRPVCSLLAPCGRGASTPEIAHLFDGDPKSRRGKQLTGRGAVPHDRRSSTLLAVRPAGV